MSNSLGFPLPLQLPKPAIWGTQIEIYHEDVSNTCGKLPFINGVDDVYKDSLNVFYFILGEPLKSATIDYGLVPF